MLVTESEQNSRGLENSPNKWRVLHENDQCGLPRELGNTSEESLLKKKIVRCFLIKRQNREKKSSTRGRKRVKEIFNIKLHILRVTFDMFYMVWKDTSKNGQNWTINVLWEFSRQRRFFFSFCSFSLDARYLGMGIERLETVWQAI